MLILFSHYTIVQAFTFLIASISEHAAFHYLQQMSHSMPDTISLIVESEFFYGKAFMSIIYLGPRLHAG